MSPFRWIMFSLLTTLMIYPCDAVAQDIKWYNATQFEIEGKGWAQTAGPFDRLPDSAKSKVAQHVWDLSKDSSGICIRFATNATTVNVRWSVTSDSLDMHHMPATGVSGVDLYARSSKGQWKFVGNGTPYKKDDNNAEFTFAENTGAMHECLLYLPLYNGTKSLEIGVPSSARLESPAPRPEHLRKPVVFYGTSITQGGCASRPGMTYAAILGRMLDRPVIDLGFSGSGTMEAPIGEVLAELDPAAYVIDCLWNIGDIPQSEYTSRISSLVQAIRRAHPLTPIVFVAQSQFRPEAHPTEFSRRQETSVISLQKQGDKNLVLVPGAHLIGDDGEGTVDGVHLTDLGMDRQARCLLPVLKKLLR